MNSEGIRKAIAAAVSASGVDCDVRVFAELASTNTWLMSQPPPANGTAQAVLALHQTAGRGRQGRRWESPPGSGLALSVAYTYPQLPPLPAALTLALGVATARTLETLGLGEAMLKWPNDIVWQDRKLGGILVETSQAPDGAFRVVAGVGINIALPNGFSLTDNTSEWARGIVDLKTASVDIALGDLAAALLPALLDCLSRYGAESLADAVAAFNRRHWLHERVAELDGQMLRCGDIDDDGQLQAIAMRDGRQHTVSSGELKPLAWSAT